MLSNPTSGLQARQRLHRRQNSTPSAFEGAKVPALPTAAQRQAAHRRGMSLDLRRQQAAPAVSRQGHMVSTNTNNNTGLATHPQHHVLREAQQQRIQARPGTHQQQRHYAPLGHSGSENYLISPHGTPQTQRFDSSCLDSAPIPFDPFGENLYSMMQNGQMGLADGMTASQDFELFTSDSALSTPTFMNFSESPTAPGWMSEGDTASSKRSSRRISNGIMDRVNKFENLGIDEPRPITPPNQNVTQYFPPTPMETPHDRMLNQQSRPDRFSEGYDESMEETLKPSRSRSNQRAQSIFQDMRLQAESQPAVSTPQQQIADMGPSEYTDGSSFNEDDFIKFEPSFDASQHEPDTASSNPVSHAGSMTPNGVNISPAADADSMGAQQYASSSPDDMFNSNATPHRSSPHRRTESLASIASAASISDIKIEETKTDTGVSLDDIAQYITGPDANDGKWTCIFDDCNKKFGRKENIKSHVQTHLNDRQYQCPTCKKCFVRQHDLKRHAKIHTGIKPYPCECGNSFARHDALTRHRQRGMCIGAFDGVVRKVVKRGRPRKNRPDLEDRLNKSARTRKKNLSVSSVSSQSGYTDSSAGNSPINDFQMLDEMMGMGSQSSSAPMPMMDTHVTAVEMMASPSIASPHSYVSPEAIMERIASHPASPAKSHASHYNTPPELSQSSSPPATHFFESEPNSSGIDELAGLTARSSVMTSASMDATAMPMGFSGDQSSDDILLQFTNDDSGLVPLDRDPSLMMLTKFDDEFESGTGMFADSDDIFFGTS